MKTTSSLGIAVVLTAMVLPLSPLLGGEERDRPNVVVLLTDDQGYGDLSCHGNPVLETPNLDRLHSQSVCLTDFHVAPKCTPTRGQLMTGLDAMRNGATRVCQGRSMMRSEVPTMATLFSRSGYSTGHFGKWHLGDSYPHRPQDRGFDETIHHGAWGITSIPDHYANDYWDDTYRHNGALQKYEGYCTDVWFEQAMEWMEARQAEDRPFFCYLATNCPHVPNRAPEKFTRRYADAEGPTGFYGQIANIDGNVGRLLRWMDERGLAENTILIFMGDNGTSKGAGVYNAGMRGNKGSLYEGGHRVACFIRWPGGDLGKPRKIDALTQCQDILPTLIDLTGLDVPETARARFDGASLAGLLRGTTDTLGDRTLVVQYGADPRKGNAAVMRNKWRLVRGELYDLREDPGQENNVADEHPDVLASMQRAYDQWWKGVQRPFSETRWIRLGSPEANPTMLYSSDWDGAYADNRNNLIAGKGTGRWHVKVERDGLYEFTLYRWWPHADKTLDEPYDANKKKRYTLAKGAELGSRDAPYVGSVGFEIEATFEPSDESGVIVAQGGGRFGYSLYLEEGRLRFALRNKGKLTEYEVDESLPGGTTSVTVDVDGENRVRIALDGRRVLEGEAPSLLAEMPRDGLQVGRDANSQVGSYEGANPYPGPIHLVRISVDEVRGRGARPIVAAGLEIGDVSLRSETPKDKEGAKSVRFTTRLEAGRYELQTMFYDEEDDPLCGAFYTRVERK